MCGIVGIYSRKGQAPFSDLWPSLVNSLYHRGPDEGAFWSDGPFFFGHRRLSIIDLKGGSQPMSTKDGALVVTFNGEIYNYIEVKKELEAQGYLFSTNSDTEVLLHGFHKWGTSLPEHLSGMFSFAIADRRNNTLYLARDRFGEKPLFYYQSDNYIAFASELGTLSLLPDIDRRIDQIGLGGYLALNYVPDERTLFHGIQRIKPATWKSFNATSTNSDKYWQPLAGQNKHIQNDSRSKADIIVEWEERFNRSVKLALTSDVPVGIFLSGGIDSTLVAHAATTNGNLSDAYFLDFKEASYSEFPAANEVAKSLGIPLRKIELSVDNFENFIKLVEHADCPLADSSAIAVWTISKLASQGNKVVLGGDGGDELFCGYLTHKATTIHTKFTYHLPKLFRSFLSILAEQIPISENKVSFTYKLWRFLRAMKLPPQIAHFTWNGTWLPEFACNLVTDKVEKRNIENSLKDLANIHGLKPNSPIEMYQLADMREYLPNDILTKTDRMSMAHSLEVRAPFLEHSFAEWALQIPQELKMGLLGELKRIPRAVAKKHFGSSIANRKKQGFSIPVHSWIRGPLRGIFEELLSIDSLAELDFLDSKVTRKQFELHCSGKRSYGFELWGLAILVAWYRARIKSVPTIAVKDELTRRSFPDIYSQRSTN